MIIRWGHRMMWSIRNGLQAGSEGFSFQNGDNEVISWQPGHEERCGSSGAATP